MGDIGDLAYSKRNISKSSATVPKMKNNRKKNVQPLTASRDPTSSKNHLKTMTPTPTKLAPPFAFCHQLDMPLSLFSTLAVECNLSTL